jgi:3-hydroxyacyl-CoA dehydrogenase
MVSWVDRRDDDQALALQHVARAEASAKTPPEVDLARAQPVERVAIVGGGLMGGGIAAACLFGGLGVTILERDGEAAKAASDRVSRLLDGAVKRGKLSAEDKAASLSRFEARSDVAGARDADLAIEAVFEDLEAKREVFRTLETVLRPDAPIATNTSYLDPLDIGADLADPSRVVGLHFFSPAHVMKLLEVVHTPLTSKDVLATAFAFAARLGKVAVPAGICDGFIGNRMLQAYRRQADYMLLDGCLPHEIDQAMRGFGMPMGPYELQDLTGLQISFANRRRQESTRDPAERYVTIGDRLVEMNRLGQRSGKGWYFYEEGDRTPRRDPEVEALIEKISRADGIDRRSFSDEEIKARLLAALINEGGRILDEGVACRASDIDLVKIHGYGFPKMRGGPMYLAERAGRASVLATMLEVAEQSPNSWRVADYLQS